MLIGLKKLSLVQKALNQNSVKDFIATKLQNDVFSRHKKFSCMPALKLSKTLSTFDDQEHQKYLLLGNKLLAD